MRSPAPKVQLSTTAMRSASSALTVITRWLPHRAEPQRTARLALRTGVLALLLSLAAAGCQVLNLNRSGAPNATQGRITWPKDGDLWVFDLATKRQEKITNLPSGAAVTGASWSPDGQRVAFAQFWRRPNERSSGADLFVGDADGSNAHPLVERDAPNTVLEAPQWMPSGRIYYTMRQVDQGKAQVAAAQTALDQAQAQLQLQLSPATSQDIAQQQAAVDHRVGVSQAPDGSRLHVLVVGGGGREHALAWACQRSPLVERVSCAPGNAGTLRLWQTHPASATDAEAHVALASAAASIFWAISSFIGTS